MKSSLLANEIQDLDGLELKEQVKVLKEYIEYMREQLRWYNDVTDKAGDEYVQGVTTYYGKSNSSNIQPTQWSKEAPEISDGEYLWQYTKVTRSGITTKSDPVCVSSATDGEDAAIIYIHSSNGTIFRANNTGTVLTVTVYYGSDAIRTLTNLQTAFGADAHLAWYERAYGSSTDVLISPSDSRISNYGFTLTLTSADISNRATYSCHLMLSATEERAQGSITITDIEDGQTLYATSQTAATTAAKTATVQSGTFALEAGAMVAVMFANKNTAANPTLNVDNTGAIPIRAGNASLAANSKYNWTDNSTVIFIYDGTYWQMDGVPALDKADDAAKVATNYITDVNNGVEVAGNSATSSVQITDSVDIKRNGVSVANYGSTARIGKASETRTEIDYHSLRLVDKDSKNYLYISDLRDDTGYARVRETMMASGVANRYYVTAGISSINSVTVNGTATTNYTIENEYTILFSNIPAKDSVIVIDYTTASTYAKAFTFGTRKSNSALAPGSFAAGVDVEASGGASVALGFGSEATARGAYAQGEYSSAPGEYAHAEGSYTIARGSSSHAEGDETIATGSASHAEGILTQATGSASHAEGEGTIASGLCSHAGGMYTKASSVAQTVFGQYNVEDTNNEYAFIIGNGTALNRSNALAVKWDGTIVSLPEQVSITNANFSSISLFKWGGICVLTFATVALTANISITGLVPSGYRPITSIINNINGHVYGVPTGSARCVLSSSGDFSLQVENATSQTYQGTIVYIQGN